MITAWRKSSFSGSQATSECVEVGVGPGTVGVRDTKSPERGHLTVAAPTWRAFVRHVAK